MDKKVGKFLFSSSKKYLKFIFCLLLVESFSEILRRVFIPYSSKILIDNLNANISYIKIVLYSLVLSLIYFLKDGAWAIGNYLSLKSIEKIKNDIKVNLFQQIVNYKYEFFINFLNGSITDSIQNFANSVKHLFKNVLILLFPKIIAFLFCLLIFMRYNIFMSLITLIWAFVYIMFFIKMDKSLKTSNENFYIQENKINGLYTDIISNLFYVKIFNNYKQEYNNITNSLNKSYEKNIIKTNNIIFSKIVQNILSFLVLFFNSLISIYLKHINIISISDIIFINGLTLEIVYNIRDFSSLYLECMEDYSMLNVSADALFKNEYLMEDNINKQLLLNNCSININDITFKYKNTTTNIFTHFNLTIQPNQKVGLVGYSGAGKSTLINLLMRFFDIEEGNGSIEIDNQDIRDVTQESLRQNISYIPQDPILFHRTIRENIAYGKLNATEEEIIEASKKANCYEFIMNLENKFDTLVGERGIKLSGGQRQRIAIARAILKNSKILILDEATSALDSITEKEIQEALKNLMENKTVIAVAHRLSTLDNMDRIIVLDKGIIVEDGTKQELLKNKDGLFSKMWEMQKGGFIE